MKEASSYYSRNVNIGQVGTQVRPVGKTMQVCVESPPSYGHIIDTPHPNTTTLVNTLQMV